MFGNTPLGVEKDGKWHVTVPSNFPQGGFKGWSNCAFMTVTPDRRYAPAVCKDPNVGPGDTFVIDLPKVPAEHTVQVIRVVMPQLLDYETSNSMRCQPQRLPRRQEVAVEVVSMNGAGSSILTSPRQ